MGRWVTEKVLTQDIEPDAAQSPPRRDLLACSRWAERETEKHSNIHNHRRSLEYTQI